MSSHQEFKIQCLNQKSVIEIQLVQMELQSVKFIKNFFIINSKKSIPGKFYCSVNQLLDILLSKILQANVFFVILFKKLKAKYEHDREKNTATEITQNLNYFIKNLSPNLTIATDTGLYARIINRHYRVRDNHDKIILQKTYFFYTRKNRIDIIISINWNNLGKILVIFCAVKYTSSLHKAFRKNSMTEFLDDLENHQIDHNKKKNNGKEP